MPNLPEGPAAMAHLQRQLDTIQQFPELKSRCRFPPDPGSALATLSDALPDAPVSIEESCAVGIEVADGAVQHIAHLLEMGEGFPPVVLYSLLRTALMGAGRVVFALGPDDHDDRVDNSLMVLRQESNSLTQGLKSFSTFSHLHELVPPEDVSSAWMKNDRELNVIGKPMGDHRTLVAMAKVIAQQLVADADPTDDDPVVDVIADHIEWIWHTYSGVAHGFAWPRRMPTCSSPSVTPMPGDFFAEFGLVVPLTHLALTKAAERSRA